MTQLYAKSLTILSYFLSLLLSYTRSWSFWWFHDLFKIQSPCHSRVSALRFEPPSLNSMYNHMQDHLLEMTQREIKPTSHPSLLWVKKIDSNPSENWDYWLKKKKKNLANDCLHTSKITKWGLGGSVRSCHRNGQILLRYQGPIPRAPGHPWCSWLLRELNNNLAIARDFLKGNRPSQPFTNCRMC